LTSEDEDDPSPRGYTGHEMLDDLGLIHMNGRIYDPLLGRFLSADVVIQAPFNLQGYNRYTYTLNSPLNLTDPSGYVWDTALDVGSVTYGVGEALGHGAAGIVGTAQASQMRRHMNAEPGNVDPYTEQLVRGMEDEANEHLEKSVESVKGVVTDATFAVIPFGTAAPRRVAQGAEAIHDAGKAAETAADVTSTVGRQADEVAPAAAKIDEAAPTTRQTPEVDTQAPTASDTVNNTDFPRDFQTKETKQQSADFSSEGEARQLAREKVGKDPVDIGDNKLRSQDGRWQYRAKAVDTADNHVHLERINPETGEVIENWHLRYPEEQAR